MKRKIISITIEIPTCDSIDSKVVRPVSRSDIINSVLEYILKTPGMIEYFVAEKLKELEVRANSTQE